MSEPTDDLKIDAARLERGECTVCGYIYEPVDGDRSRGVVAGTSLDDLPQDWRCPNCRASVTRFKRITPRVGSYTGLEENSKFGIGVNVLNPQLKNLLIFGGLLLGLLLLLSFYFVEQ
jgi:rubredoxin